MQFATENDLRTHLGLGVDDPLPEDGEQALAVADEIIHFRVRFAVYDITNAVTLTALKRATLAQASYLLESGDLSGFAAAWSNMALGSLSLGTATNTPGASGEDPLTSMSSTVALLILANAGLKTQVGSAW